MQHDWLTDVEAIAEAHIVALGTVHLVARPAKTFPRHACCQTMQGANQKATLGQGWTGRLTACSALTSPLLGGFASITLTARSCASALTSARHLAICQGITQRYARPLALPHASTPPTCPTRIGTGHTGTTLPFVTSGTRSRLKLTLSPSWSQAARPCGRCQRQGPCVHCGAANAYSHMTRLQGWLPAAGHVPPNTSHGPKGGHLVPPPGGG